MFIFTLLPSILGWYKAKQEAQMKLYQIAWEATKAITVFIVRNWLVILKWSIAIAIISYVLSLRAHNVRLASEITELNNEKAHIQRNFNDYVNAIAKLAEEREAEIKLKSEQGKKETANLLAAHRKSVTKILKGSANEKTLNDSKLNAMRDGLRLALERENSPRLPENDINTGLSIDDTSGSVARCETIEAAATLCAADFSLWRDYALDQQKRIGVEND
jgi:hypothetical protein